MLKLILLHLYTIHIHKYSPADDLETMGIAENVVEAVCLFFFLIL